MKLTGSQIVMEVLLDHGVDTVFGYPGGAALNIYDELYKYSDRIRHVLSAHEQGASHAADGYARATGKTGVVFSTSGPGATNLVTGIATAYMDSVPLVAITSNVDNSLIGRDAFQEVYISGITIPITKMNYFVNDISELEDALRNAFRIAASGRKGPVLVDITKDVSAAKWEFTNKEPLPLSPPPKVSEEDIREMARLINGAEKPVMYIGGGAATDKASELIRTLAARADIPTVHTLMADGVVSCDSKYDLGLVGMHGTVAANRAVDHADIILALGARFSDRVALNPKRWGKRAKILQIDIDHSEVNKNISIDKSLVGDVEDCLTRMIPHLEETTHPEWRQRVSDWKKKHQAKRKVAGGMDPKVILESICDLCNDDTIYVTDVGQHQMWSAQYLKIKQPRKFLTSGGLGTMGYGYGAAIGAKIGRPDLRVVHITGDGSFHMNLNEGCTAVSQQLPIITVIFNNRVLGMVYQWQGLFYEGRISSTAPERKTDFVKLAEGFGAKGFRVEKIEDFKPTMEKAMKEKGPVWIECLIEEEEKVLPMIPSGKTVEDIILD